MSKYIYTSHSGWEGGIRVFIGGSLGRDRRVKKGPDLRGLRLWRDATRAQGHVRAPKRVLATCYLKVSKEEGLVALKEEELNHFFEILENWEEILQAEKSLLNNTIEDSQSTPTSEQGVAS